MKQQHVYVCALANHPSQARGVVSGWLDEDFPRKSISLLATYEAAKGLGDIITRIADPETEAKLDAFLAWLEQPALLEVKGLGPFVVAGPVSNSDAWKNRAQENRISEALKSVGAPADQLQTVVDALGEGKIFLGIYSFHEDRLPTALAVLRTWNLQPLATLERSSLLAGSESDGNSAYSDLSPKKVGELMERNIASVTVTIDTELDRAMQRLRESGKDFLAVVSDELMVGIVTAPSIPVRAQASSPALGPLRVGDVMTDQFQHCFETQTAGEAAAMMERCCLTWLPVLDREGRLRGVIDSTSSLFMRADEERLSD